MLKFVKLAWHAYILEGVSDSDFLGQTIFILCDIKCNANIFDANAILGLYLT